jgi:hypothetical protein
MNDQGPEFDVVEDEKVIKDLEGNDKVAIVAVTARPGVRSLIIATEWRLFCPLDQALNDKFELLIRKWMDMVFVIMIIPSEYKEKVEQVASEFKLRLANGFPVVLGGDGAHRFPITCPDDRSFCVENVPGSAVYEKDGASIYEEESAYIDKFWAEEKQKAVARYQ